MNLQKLREYLDHFTAALNPNEREILEARLQGLVSVFPFNEYEYILMFLRDREVISLDDYEKLRDNYVSENRNLELYGLAPRIFGQVWGEEHIKDLDPRFQKPDQSLDPEYQGQYDLWIEGVRIEVKAARAIHTKKRGDVVSKALRFGEEGPFWMNYQQLKLDICDAFVFIGVWVDRIVYWLLTNDDVKQNQYLSHQHRGGIEYQIGITHNNISEFERFRVPPEHLADRIMAPRR